MIEMDNTTTEIISFIASGIAITGVILNNRMSITGFKFWWISNLMSAFLHCQPGLYSLMIRDLVFFLLAVVGFVKWKNKQ